MKKLIALVVGVVAVSAFAQTNSVSFEPTTAASSARQSNAHPAPTVYLKAGTLFCKNWRNMRAAEVDAFKSPVADQNKILKRYDCEIVSSREKVDLVPRVKGSSAAEAYAARELIAVRLSESDGSLDYGFVGGSAIEN
jgi:hypothetical protein